MNAQLETFSAFRPMRHDDIEEVAAVERQIYPYPWTLGNFRDSLNAGYSCWVFEHNQRLIGYSVMMIAAGEAHLLNLGIAGEWQGQGLGRRFLEHILGLARSYRVEAVFLEVRPSNVAARQLYLTSGFRETAVRKKYYPADDGREDAILMELSL